MGSLIKVHHSFPLLLPPSLLQEARAQAWDTGPLRGGCLHKNNLIWSLPQLPECFLMSRSPCGSAGHASCVTLPVLASLGLALLPPGSASGLLLSLSLSHWFHHTGIIFRLPSLLWPTAYPPPWYFIFLFTNVRLGLSPFTVFDPWRVYRKAEDTRMFLCCLSQGFQRQTVSSRDQWWHTWTISPHCVLRTWGTLQGAPKSLCSLCPTTRGSYSTSCNNMIHPLTMAFLCLHLFILSICSFSFSLPVSALDTCCVCQLMQPCCLQVKLGGQFPLHDSSLNI